MIIGIGAQGARVIDLEQRSVYADVIEGAPDARINQRIVDAALERARRLHGGEPCLIPPTQAPLTTRGEPKSALPSVCCIARVRGGLTADPDAEFAEACVVWFQAEVGAALEPATAQAFAALRWEDVSRDVFW